MYGVSLTPPRKYDVHHVNPVFSLIFTKNASIYKLQTTTTTDIPSNRIKNVIHISCPYVIFPIIRAATRYTAFFKGLVSCLCIPIFFQLTGARRCLGVCLPPSVIQGDRGGREIHRVLLLLPVLRFTSVPKTVVQI